MKTGQADPGSVTFHRTPNDTVQFKRHMSGFGRVQLLTFECSDHPV